MLRRALVGALATFFVFVEVVVPNRACAEQASSPFFCGVRVRQYAIRSESNFACRFISEAPHNDVKRRAILDLFNQGRMELRWQFLWIRFPRVQEHWCLCRINYSCNGAIRCLGTNSSRFEPRIRLFPKAKFGPFSLDKWRRYIKSFYSLLNFFCRFTPDIFICNSRFERVFWIVGTNKINRNQCDPSSDGILSYNNLSFRSFCEIVGIRRTITHFLQLAVYDTNVPYSGNGNDSRKENRRPFRDRQFGGRLAQSFCETLGGFIAFVAAKGGIASVTVVQKMSRLMSK